MKDEVKRATREENQVVAILLFGSRAKGEETQKSDYDLAILYQKGNIPDKLHLIQLREKLSDELEQDVDLVCLNTCSPIIGMQAMGTGKNLIINDQDAYDRYTMDLFTDYCDLKMMRNDLEDNILQRKYFDKS